MEVDAEGENEAKGKAVIEVTFFCILQILGVFLK